MNKSLNCRMDNSSAVFTWRKGYSTRDKLSTVVVKTIFELASHLNSKVFVTKIARCSSRESIAVDALSKGDFGAFFGASPSLHLGQVALGSSGGLFFGRQNIDRVEEGRNWGIVTGDWLPRLMDTQTLLKQDHGRTKYIHSP